MHFLHIVIMAVGLVLWVYSRDERIYVFQTQIQSRSYISKCNPNPKSKSCLNSKSYHWYYVRGRFARSLEFFQGHFVVLWLLKFYFVPTLNTFWI